MNKEAAYWIALAHLPGWRHQKINSLIIQFYHEEKISIEEFFSLSENNWQSKFSLNQNETDVLLQAKTELPNNAFLAETMINEGYEFIPITSAFYSKTLKENLKTSYAPPLLYIKGNKQIMQEKSIAIVGSRNASEKSLEFTDTIAKIASTDYKVVVSGFAKGVDKQALDSAIKYKGQSIIVLPQGIMTFGTGFKKYYKQMVDGDVLVLSTFFPKVPWKVELAMARNPIIYGLASEIYVAESAEKGGTWAGVTDGLRKNRIIYVRQPDPSENNANNLLIKKGAVAVDFYGNLTGSNKTTPSGHIQTSINEPTADYEITIFDLLKKGEYSAKEIVKNLQLSWTEKKLRDFLKNHPQIETIQKKPLRFTMKDSMFKQKTLFD